MKYILGIDQSTQGTKLALVGENGRIISKLSKPHRQIISKEGWISHDMKEIYGNVLAGVKELVEQAGIDSDDILYVAICNQRETTVIWDNAGEPIENAVVWQCNRASTAIEKICADKKTCDYIYKTTGLPLSSFFPAAKMKWLMENSKNIAGRDIFFGTVDCFLIYRLTGGRTYATDFSNASRTQLFSIEKLSWDKKLCGIFGVPYEKLPQIIDSDGFFGETDFEGILEKKIPIHAVMGDSHAALYGQGCLEEGMLKVTYGTGSSMMLNTGRKPIIESKALSTSVAFRTGGRTCYSLEGNINYAGAVISWLRDKAGIIHSEDEVNCLCEQASSDDRTVFIPAFSGLSAPYWNNDVRACLMMMDRNTGKAEIVKAAVESIANQVADIAEIMEETYGEKIDQIRADGGPTGNRYLMSYQAGITNKQILVSDTKELSLLGVVLAAGSAVDFFDKSSFENVKYNLCEVTMARNVRTGKRKKWKEAIRLLTGDME
ncbi:MAG: glycerol kinase [Butyrivibrio sp.]|uniref:FGGY-family carbohydrate kinase n=1 Tax=Butyrivibrio sp. TaxID=28121 RepID=UPI0025D6C3BB|nr:FGGY family carbohydrate kinase [Butyrivibrio sp.]MCR5772421.1 glycerol kinase [Butyrivibrio sp.]